MQPDGESRLGQLESLVASKEREWKDLQTEHIRHLESCLAKSKEECVSLRREQQKLSEDFQYNLELLDERDQELERYDLITSRAVALEHNRQQEVERLRRQVEKLEEEKQQQQLQQEKLDRSMAREVHKQQQESERMKRDWQTRIQTLEGQLVRQKKEMTAAFQKQLQLQKHNFDLKLDQNCAMLIGSGVKMTRLSEEKEAHYQAQLEATQLSEQLHTQLRHKDHRIQELEAKLKEKDEHAKRYETTVQELRECEGTLGAQRQAHTEQLQRSEQHIVKLHEDMKALSAKALSANKQKETLKQKDQAIQRYKQQLSTCLKREKASEQTRVQLELDWQKRCEDMKAEVYQANEQLIEELSQAREQAEAELREKEREVRELTNMVQNLIHQRDQAAQLPAPNVERLEEIRSLHRALNDVKGLCHRIHHSQAELQAAAATADKQTCTEPAADFSTDGPAGYARALEQEVSTLKARCRELQWQLESATRRPSPATEQPAPSNPTTADKQTCTEPAADTYTGGLAGYARALEQEVSLLKARCRQLERQLESATSRPSTATEQPATSNPASTHAPLKEEGGRRRPLQYGEDASQRSPSEHEVKQLKMYWASKEKLKARLREAVCRIISMTREREVLLELSNNRNAKIRRLEAAATSRPTPATDKPTEGPTPSDPTAAAATADKQTATEPVIDFSTARLRVSAAAGSVSSPETAEHQRQQQLSSQEQKAGPSPGTSSPPFLPGALESRPQSQQQSCHPENCENTKTPPPPHVSMSEQHPGEALQSLKDLWRTLDHGLNITSQSEGESELSRREASGWAAYGMTVYGVTAPLHSQPALLGQQRSETTKALPNTSKTSRPALTSRTSRVRNYNIKD